LLLPLVQQNIHFHQDKNFFLEYYYFPQPGFALHFFEKIYYLDFLLAVIFKVLK